MKHLNKKLVTNQFADLPVTSQHLPFNKNQRDKTMVNINMIKSITFP